MTIICVKDGVLAVDSAAYMGNLYVGRVVKWTKVAAKLGGGFAAASGSMGGATTELTRLAKGEELEISGDYEVSIVHLKLDGSLRIFWKSSGWTPMDTPFFAKGIGEDFAAGAMAAGASAVEAAELTCRYMDGCKAPVIKCALPGR